MEGTENYGEDEELMERADSEETLVPTENATEIEAKTAVLQWFASAKAPERMRFMNSLLSYLPLDQLRTANNNCSKAKKDWKEMARTGGIKRRRLRLYDLRISEDETEAQPMVEAPEAPKLSTGSEGSEPEGSVPQAPRGWWQQWKKSEVYGMDCEHVHILPEYLDPGDDDVVKAGSVSVVRYNVSTREYEEVYSAKIYRAAGTYLVNEALEKIAGFKEDSLVDGKPLETVQDELAEILKGKLVVTCAGDKDWRSLGFVSYKLKFSTFDIQDHYRKPAPWATGFPGKAETQAIGLKSLYYHFYNIKIQDGIHDPKVDAIATLRIFIEQYVPTKIQDNDFSEENHDFERYSDIVILPNPYRRQKKRIRRN